MEYKQHCHHNKSEHVSIDIAVSLKLSTKHIYDRNQSRIAPIGFDSTKIWIHNIRSMHNVGSVFRSADAFGISEIIISGYTPCPPRPEISKTALGADEFVRWSYRTDIHETAIHLKSEGYVLIGLEQTTESIPINALELHASLKCCIIPGNEISGIDDQLIPYIDVFVEIPQYGRKHSLNVSVALGVALYALHDVYEKGNQKG